MVLLALGGFVLSFNALTDLAVHSGIIPELAFLWPLIVDGFIVVATAAAFALKQRGRRVTWYPWTALILFSAVSVAGNASHAVNADNVTVPVWVATVVSSVPAIALLIASHLLVVMIDGKNQTCPASRKKTGESRKPPVQVRPTEAKPSAPQPSVPGSDTAEEPDPERDPEPHLRAVEKPEEPREATTLVDKLMDAVQRGEEINAVLIARLEGVSERTGRRRLTQLRESHPQLFAVDDARELVR